MSASALANLQWRKHFQARLGTLPLLKVIDNAPADGGVSMMPSPRIKASAVEATVMSATIKSSVMRAAAIV